MKLQHEIHTRPVDKNNWQDFVTLFQAKGGPSYCWCMAWRMTKEELKENTSANRYEFIKKRVESGTPIGLLAYAAGTPVGWCSIAPRETYGLEEMKTWLTYGL